LGAVKQPGGNDEARQRAEIARQRDVIDAVDEQLLRLLNQRAEAALVIARAKRALGLPIYDPVREQTILDGVRAQNSGPFEADAVSSLFERIIDETRRLERRTRGQDSPEED
jgi:chorismate mutase